MWVGGVCYSSSQTERWRRKVCGDECGHRVWKRAEVRPFRWNWPSVSALRHLACLKKSTFPQSASSAGSPLPPQTSKKTQSEREGEGINPESPWRRIAESWWIQWITMSKEGKWAWRCAPTVRWFNATSCNFTFAPFVLNRKGVDIPGSFSPFPTLFYSEPFRWSV